MSNKKIYELLKETIPMQHNIINGSIESIESKSGFIIGSIGVFMPIVIAIVVNGNRIINNFLYIGTGLALISLLLNIIVLWSKKYHVNPDIKDFYHRNKNKSENTQREKLLALTYIGLVKNSNKLEWKGKVFNSSLVIFILSVFFIIIGIFAQSPKKDYNMHTDNNYSHDRFRR